ncbi:hypothetical protein GcM1_237076 [Golovinomyces cichoracearum]|uniref:Uncharacterized protein n=1 Tax=Golovinomyces cichoracearum TaxID=62708 RepID=A0A420IK62_9PEZI|nr:hypothetical protein GcM1_237076 [Golovinomyces cichoracearum]
MTDNRQEIDLRPIMSSDSPRPHGQTQKSEFSQEAWDEERLDKALKTLKEMHIQLRNLRTTIPRIIAPLTTQYPTPQILYYEFKKSIKAANKEIQGFRQLMTAEESKQIFFRATTNQVENSECFRPWAVSEHPDWLNSDS